MAVVTGHLNKGSHFAHGRHPLPAGHPLSWGAITRGTILEGAPYTPPAPPIGRSKLSPDNLAAPLELAA